MTRYRPDAKDARSAADVSRWRMALGLLPARQRVALALLVATRIGMGFCDLLLAGAMYVVFLLLQGGTLAAHRWWTPKTVLSASCLTMVLVLARIVIDIGSTAWMVRFTQNLYGGFLLRLTEGYGQMRWSQFVQRNRSEMLKHSTSTALDAAFSYQMFIESIAGSTVVCLFAFALVYQSPKLAISLGLITLLLYALHRFAMRDRLAAAAAQRESSLRVLQRAVTETLAANKEVRTYRNQTFFHGRIHDEAARVASSNVRLAALPQVARVLAEQGVVMLFLGIVIAVELQHGPMRQLLSLLVFYFVLSRRILPMISTLALTFGQLEGAYENLQIIHQELHDCMVYRSVPAVLETPAPGFVLEIEDLSFSYEDGTRILRGLSLRVRAGEIVILRGVSGSGKSSLLNLVAGVSHPDAGVMRLDRGSVAYVPQEITLLDDSIRNNLLFGMAAASDAELFDCLAAVNLGEFVASLPGGLETRVGDNGVLFSGGQRQRLGLARAMVRRVSLLLLDEATSALDDENERHVLRNLASMQVAILMVTHRTDGHQFADRTQRLEDGVLLEPVAAFEEDALSRR
ncbi:ABC-type multidrug transport system, ATPase and permease component [Granulicella pectinivorans]|uniref:ABC-type multidrug transport system, ATPase and permease component n=1 Tax=Granulicella pectinivorans TaxID=474950 RepID=A0A1I6M9N9_9BACT|nr:ABC transporter ATP-binding protein [Granulicella pectinivorans]SFS12357.1 ABC-type multidrug transport system, ATPase and permease component [Granulicella pectinivorans]